MMQILIGIIYLDHYLSQMRHDAINIDFCYSAQGLLELSTSRAIIGREINDTGRPV